MLQCQPNTSTVARRHALGYERGMASPKKKVTPENPRRRRGRPPGKRFVARVNASLPADLMAAIVRLAAAEDRSPGYVVRALVLRGLEAAFQRRSDPSYGVLYPQEGIVEFIVHKINAGELPAKRGGMRGVDAHEAQLAEPEEWRPIAINPASPEPSTTNAIGRGQSAAGLPSTVRPGDRAAEPGRSRLTRPRSRG